MNKLRGRVVGVESNGQISLVDVESGGNTFTATVLEGASNAAYMQMGAEIALMFKETEVSLAKNLSGLISLRNRFAATVQGITLGELLSAVQLDYQGQMMTSVVTTRAVKRLELAIGDEVEALVKANEMMLGVWE